LIKTPTNLKEKCKITI